MSGSIEFLTFDEAAAAQSDLQDVYYTAEYGRTAELIDGGSWECATDGQWWFPYIRRVVPGSPDEFDLVTPYGYGGFAGRGSLESLAEFRRRFHEVGRQRGLIAEFIRAHPLDLPPERVKDALVDSYRQHPTFAVRVGTDREDYWHHAEGRHRTAVRKAQKAGVVVAPRDNATLLDPDSPFRMLYAETMERVGSHDRLQVGTDYFERLITALGDRLLLIEAADADGVCASSLFLVWGDRVHYHLSGSSQTGMRNGASNAILDHVTRQVVPTGGVFHLGGGVHEGDGLEKFKSSLANERLVVCLARAVVNPGRYDELVADQGVSPDTTYFPAYRAR